MPAGTVLAEQWAEVGLHVRALALGAWPLATIGDNSSSRTIDFGGLQNVRRLDLTLRRSGALAELVHCPTSSGARAGLAPRVLGASIAAGVALLLVQFGWLTVEVTAEGSGSGPPTPRDSGQRSRRA